jgi:pimeloyl-ACP methyl ester carboxylesterase
MVSTDSTYTPPHLLIGSGDHPVIVVHGWVGDHRSFEPLWRILDRARFTYAFMDARGYGAAKGDAGEFTIAEFARDIVALADHLGWERFSLVGHSMGAMAAQRVMLTDRDRVRSLVGITPVPASGAAMDEGAWSLFSGAVEDLAARNQVFEVTSGGRSSATWVNLLAETSFERLGPDAMAGYLTSHVHDGFEDGVRGAETPILVLIGEHDPAITRDGVEQTWSTYYEDLEIRTLGNAAHYPMDETPVSLVTELEAFLASR